MLRRNSIFMVIVLLMAVSGFALSVPNLNNQAIGEEGGDRQGLSSTGREKPHEDPVVNTILLQNQPPEKWVLMATDPDEGSIWNLKAVYAQFYSGILYFKVEHYEDWLPMTWGESILIDADQDTSTGENDGYHPGQYTGIGADYRIFVSRDEVAMFRWSPFWIDSIPLAYVDTTYGTKSFVVGVDPTDLEPGLRPLHCVVLITYPSIWDWMPDTGHFTCPTCFCGDASGDGTIDLGDVLYLINYLYKGGPPPDCY